MKIIFFWDMEQCPSKGVSLHLVVVVGLVQLCDPESNAGGSLTTSRVTHPSKVKG
jgi:hypothetical protein